MRKGLLRGRKPRWVHTFPPGLSLKSSGNDAQTPDVSVTIPRFSRPVLNFQVELREQSGLTEVFVAHLKSKLPERVDKERWFKADEATFKPHAEERWARRSPRSAERQRRRPCASCSPRP